MCACSQTLLAHFDIGAVALNGMPLVDLTPMSLTDLCARFTYHELSSLCGRAFHAPSGAIALLALMLMHKPTCEALARRALPSA